MSRRMMAMLMAAFSIAVAPVAEAGTMCGLKTFLDEFKAGVKHEGFSSMCLAWQGCSIFSDRVMGHRLQLAKQRDEKQWTVLLTLPHEADVGEGVELQVDNGEPMRIPPEFLDERAAGRAIAISTKLTDVVLPELRKGKLLNWTYTHKDGRRDQVAIPLKGLDKVLDWAACTAKTLDEMAEKRGRGR